MRRVIVGTAGHIDHGKTTLVKALTGIDCDRWAEEKARGITIDIGFAHLTEDDLQLGFVDVPGHERFVHNALAGLGGIRVLLLIVAADEGVKPQTREHLAICSLLGIPAALVALTKTDLVEPDLVELAQLEVEELLAGTPFADAAILPVSSQTGDGLPELRERLLELARGHHVEVDPARLTRLPIDRAFHLKGLGVVVTGTLASGTVRAGDVLDVLPGGHRVRVRSVQVHGQPREEAAAGERTSLQLTGLELDQIHRGAQVVTPDSFEITTELCGRFTLLADAPAPLRGFVPARLHLHTSEVLGRLRPLGGQVLEPGDTGLVEIRLGGPVVAVRGDHYIVRRPSPATTLGGGEVLDPHWRRYRGEILARAAEAPRPEQLAGAVQAGDQDVGGAGARQAGGTRPRDRAVEVAHHHHLAPTVHGDRRGVLPLLAGQLPRPAGRLGGLDRGRPQSAEGTGQDDRGSQTVVHFGLLAPRRSIPDRTGPHDTPWPALETGPLGRLRKNPQPG